MANVSEKFNLNEVKISYRDLNSPLLFVVDMVNGFIKEGNMHDESINAISGDIEKLLNNIHPSIFICDAHDLSAKEFDAFPLHCVKNTSESEVIDELKDYVKNKYYKNSTNAFVNDDIRGAIDDSLDLYDDYIICGCCTDICIMQFALSLNTYFNENDYKNKRVIVPINTCETYDALNHNQVLYNEMSLNLMKQSGIVVCEIGE